MFVFVFVYLAPFPNIPPGPRVSAQCLRGSFYIVMLPRFNIVCISDVVCVCICRVPPFCPTGFQHCWQSLVLTGQVFQPPGICGFFCYCLCFLPLYVETLGPGGGGCSRGWFWRGEGSQAASLRKQTAPFSHPSPLHLLICHLFSSSSPSWLHQLSLGERWIDPLLKHGIKKWEDMTAQTIYSNVEKCSNTGCFLTVPLNLQ